MWSFISKGALYAVVKRVVKAVLVELFQKRRF